MVDAIIELLEAGARTVDLSHHDRTATTAYMRADVPGT
jgi:hypothetical protein